MKASVTYFRDPEASSLISITVGGQDLVTTPDMLDAWAVAIHEAKVIYHGAPLRTVKTEPLVLLDWLHTIAD
jgi:hypothetical protein